MTLLLNKFTVVASTLFLFMATAGIVFAAPLSDPTNLSATAVSSSGIDLAWTDNASKEDGFSIERGTDGVNFVEVATVGKNVESYSDTGLSGNTTYYYKVRAYQIKRNGTNYSSYTNVDSDTTFDVVPAAPSNLQVFASSSSLSLVWTDNADNEDNFEVERGTDGVNFSLISTESANTTFYFDWPLSATTTYYYRVRATNTAGNSAYSNTASGTPF